MNITWRVWRSTLAMVLWRWRVCDAERQRLKHYVRELEAALREKSGEPEA